MDKFNDHSELPFNWAEEGLPEEYLSDNKKNNILFINEHEDGQFILEACNNYYQMKKEIEKLYDLIQRHEDNNKEMDKEIASLNGEIDNLMADIAVYESDPRLI